MAQPTPEVRAARRRLREARSSLRPAERTAAERAICATLDRLGVLQHGAHVALYLPMPGEVDLRACFATARVRGARLYVPRILSRRRRQMLFAPWTPGGARRVNAFGIVEPGSAAGARAVVALDAVVLPLVGFDRRGNRLGMGAGYYDRALRRRRARDRAWRRPLLIGVGYACQELPDIPASPWDVPLDLVVTERGVIVPRGGPVREDNHVKYWLFKTEPGTFGVDDLARARGATTAWDGVRNYQVRNMLRDEMKAGDRGFLYHSSCEVPGIYGVVKVTKAGYPERAALDRRHAYFDPKSDPANPTWYSVDVQLEKKFDPPITLETLRKHAQEALSGMLMLRRGNRLSVTPVTREEWRFICSLE